MESLTNSQNHIVVMPKIIAHRGVSAEAPENTLAAFKLALDLNIESIEFDVRITADGYPIVIHDDTLDRTTSIKTTKLIEEMTLEDIRRADAGSWFDKKFKNEKIPLLTEVLSLVQGNAQLMIEIKQSKTPPNTAVKTILKALETANNDIVLGSFDFNILEECRLQAPHLPRIPIVESQNEINHFIHSPLERIALWYPLISPHLVEGFHEQGTEVWVFTVDDPSVSEFLDSLGIDGIISNNPRLVRSHLLKGSKDRT